MQEGGYIMQGLPQSASGTTPASVGMPMRTHRREELIYEAVTIAAMLIVLVTVWVF